MFRTLACKTLLLVGLMVTAASAHSAGSVAAIESIGTPAGFDELARPREILIDIYFGGRKVGEAVAVSSPGTVRFNEPGKLLALLPDVSPSPELIAALSGDLPSHPELVCSAGNSDRCGSLMPDVVGIIFDEGRFRADLFVAPRLMPTVRPNRNVYLKPPTAPVSLTSSVGLAISGSSRTSTSYNVQNRTVLAFRNLRIRSDSAYASGLGVIVDDLVAEVDRRDLRYSAGLFWAPGLDLTGRRRIVGAGFGTQFDTRADRDTLQGTPLILFLQQPSRVEILVDGRLVSSGAYQAGNNVLDTTALPDGSYPLVLRVQEAGGRVHEERRFFVKNAQIAPVGKPLYFGYVGMLANTRPNRPISLSKTLFYQIGTARRLSNALALDLSAIGTDKKGMVEAGAWLVTRHARVRVAGLVSTAGDHGALVQLGSSGQGPLNFSFDLRRIWTRHDQPLLPLPSYIDNFGAPAPTGAQVGNGSYTQISGSVGYNFGTAYLSVIGSLRHDKGIATDYSVGPHVSWPVVNYRGMQLMLEADAQRTRTSTTTFLGFRMLYTSGGLSVLSSAGRASRSTGEHSTADRTRAVASLTGEYFHESEDRTQMSLGGGFDRNLDSTNVHGTGSLYSRLGSARADVLGSLDGGGVQYGLTMQTGAAVNEHVVALGGRDIEQSALVASLDGESSGSAFDVLVNGQPRGRLTAGGSLPIFLQPYRTYAVRLRPIGPTAVDYDSGSREITLYPGNVQQIRWSVHSLYTVFGQALSPDGRPLANAMVQSRRGVGETNGEGYFQIDVAQGDMIAISVGSAHSCHVRVDPGKTGRDYVPVGKVICR
jgi:hypothetical protein